MQKKKRNLRLISKDFLLWKLLRWFEKQETWRKSYILTIYSYETRVVPSGLSIISAMGYALQKERISHFPSQMHDFLLYLFLPTFLPAQVLALIITDDHRDHISSRGEDNYLAMVLLPLMICMWAQIIITWWLPIKWPCGIPTNQVELTRAWG